MRNWKILRKKFLKEYPMRLLECMVEFEDGKVLYFVQVVDEPDRGAAFLYDRKTCYELSEDGDPYDFAVVVDEEEEIFEEMIHIWNAAEDVEFEESF